MTTIVTTAVIIYINTKDVDLFIDVYKLLIIINFILSVIKFLFL